MRSHSVLSLLLLSLAACNQPPPPSDVPDAETSVPNDAADAGAVEAGPTLPRCEDTEPDGVITLPQVNSTAVGTIVPMATRLATPMGTNPSSEAGEMLYRGMNFMRYAAGPAQLHVRRANDFATGTPTPDQRRSFAWFVHISDTQMVDDESPARLALLDNPVASGGMRPHEALIARAMSAVNRTLGRIETAAQREFQFGVITGDCADSAQNNEMKWFIQTMDGAQNIKTDSGNMDDPIPGPDNDPKDPFNATAFPAPWYFVPGNHDLFVVGINFPDATFRARAIGMNAANGTRDYTRWYAQPRRGDVPADPDRRIINISEIATLLRTMSTASPGPVGHGYAANQDFSLGGHYTQDVVPGLVRLIAFDTNDATGGSKGLVKRAVLDNFLRPELMRAQTDGVLVIMASHHPLTSIDQIEAEIGPNMVPDSVPVSEVEQVITQFPNMVLWLVGHEHDVRVRKIVGPDAAHPGFWEVQSGAIADWPNPARILEIVDNGNNTLSIYGTLVDFDANNCMERRYRRLSLMDHLSRWEPDHTGTTDDRNVELVIPTPATLRPTLTAQRATFSPIIKSETTLRGM